MATLVYALCAMTSAICAVLLLRGYFASRTPLLLWSSACFLGLFLNNALLVIDLVVVPDSDLSLARNLVGTISLGLMLFGLLWDTR